MAKASDNVFPKVILSEGSAPSAPSAGRQTLFVDSADHALKRINSSGTVTAIEGGGGASTEVLASVLYDPGSTTTYGPFTTNSETDVDATNLAITFTAPTSGKVEVFLDGLLNYTQTSFSEGHWCLRSGSTVVANAIMAGNSATSSFGTGNARQSVAFKITGLTSGNSYTYKWAWRAFPSSTLTMYAGGSGVGGAYMRVLALP